MKLTPIRRALPLAIALILIASASARAELIVLRFTGTITTQEGDQSPAIRALFPVGGAASWILSYDTNTSESGLIPDFLSDPSTGFYDSTSISWQGEIAGHSYASRPTESQRLFVNRDDPALTFDNSIRASNTRGAIAGDLVGGWFGQAFDFRVNWPGVAPFSSDNLPGALPGGIPDGFFTMYVHNSCRQVGCADRQVRLLGNITSVASIPEPASLALVAMGLVAAAVRRRKTARR